MSIENHPNFRGINFIIRILNQAYECLRCEDHEANTYVKRLLGDRMKDKILIFAEQTEQEVDKLIEEFNAQ